MFQSSCYYCLVILTAASIIAPSQSVAASPPPLDAAEPHNSLLLHSSSKRRDAHYCNGSNNNDNDINGLLISTIGNIRGGDIDDGDGEGGGTAKKKKASKSSKQGAAAAAAHQHSSKSKAGKTTTAASDDNEDEGDDSSSAKTVINTAIKDPSHALGDAIRARAHILRKDKLLPNYNYYFASSKERTFDSALVSLGLSLGTAGLDVAADDDVDEVEVEENNEEENGNDNTKQKEVKSSMMAYYQYGHGTNNNSRQHQNQQFVQPSTSAVIANYFLKTHGGTHLLQCILSLLASGLGLICIMLPSFPTNVVVTTAAGGTTTRKMMSSTTLARKILRSTTKYQLLQQTLFIAMTKHVSAIVGAVLLGAQSIPQLGLRNARRHLEGVAADPVGQYLFYCSLLVVWLGWFGGGSGGGSSSEFVSQLRRSVISIQNTAAAATAAAATSTTAEGNGNQEIETMSQLLNVLTQSSPPWFLSQSNYHLGSIIPMIILGPILLREVISIIWVVSDVLTLVFTSSGGITGKFCQGILSTMRSILDTFMSIIIPIDQWKKADSFQRQQTLAKLVSQTSLVLELIVGVVLFGDAIQAFWGYSFGGGGGSGGVVGTRLPLKIVAGKIACAHLYINFLLSRRKKIHELVVGSVRS
ncbi:hypothetical protein ACHAWC_007399 [Mediolabrus comicus]